MPNLTMKSLLTRFSLSGFILLSSLSLSAQTIANDEPADFNTELNTPVIPNKQSQAVTTEMQAIYSFLVNQGYNVEMCRNDQVVVVTINIDKLFGPNEVSLLNSASQFLQPFSQYTRHYGNFKLLLAVHSDDTGSPAYRQWLCEQRVMSLYEYFDNHSSSPSMIYGYPMALEMPLTDNNSRAKRAINRRLEIYIVPGPNQTTKASKRK